MVCLSNCEAVYYARLDWLSIPSLVSMSRQKWKSLINQTKHSHCLKLTKHILHTFIRNPDKRWSTLYFSLYCVYFKPVKIHIFIISTRFIHNIFFYFISWFNPKARINVTLHSPIEKSFLCNKFLTAHKITNILLVYEFHRRFTFDIKIYKHWYLWSVNPFLRLVNHNGNSVLLEK